MERIRHRVLEIILGLALTAVLVLGVTLVLQSFSGSFSDKISVNAELAKAGDSLEQGDIVTYRNVIVGEVSDSTGDTGGGAIAKLKIDPKDAGQIPARVTAIAVPASLFGNTKVELLPMAKPSGPMLHDGDTVHADRRPAAESLQTALANVYTLLTSVHPAQLDAALSALATALQGQGSHLNRLVAKTDRFLRKLSPHLGELDGVLTSLADATALLARNAPSLLASLRDVLVVSKGILTSKQSLDALLRVAPTTLDNTQRLLSPRTVDNIVTVLRNLVPVTGAVAEHPTALVDTIDGFRVFASTFNNALSSGPYLKANVLLTGADFTELAPLIPGGQQGKVFQSIVDPPQYTSANCPSYGSGARGPNCGSGAGTNSVHADVLTTGYAFGGSSSSIGSAREIHAVRAVAHSLTNVPESRLSAAATDLLLGPMLRGSATVIK